MLIRKAEHHGHFELSFEASGDQGLAPLASWTIRVHVPVEDADIAAAQLQCAGSNVGLTAHMPSQLYSVPFVGRHAPPNAPNAVLEGSLVVPPLHTVRCTFTMQ